MSWKRIGKWPGGYIGENDQGRRCYFIEKRKRGVRFHMSTQCSTERAAYKELEKFELNPHGYRPEEEAGGLSMSAELILEYRGYQLSKNVTPEWADEIARCLRDWFLAIGRRDFRTLDSHRDIKPILEAWKTRRPHRIKALKGFMRWLRTEKGLLKLNQDFSVDLRVPQARPEKWKRRKVVDPEDVAAVLKQLPEQTRDILHLLTATGWHISEAKRFYGVGEIVKPLQGGALAILFTRHKNGELTKKAITYQEHLDAARRIKEAKTFPTRMTIARHMRAACKAAGVPWFGMGQMRHSVLTWAVAAGASAQAASEFAGHKSPSTTRRFYIDLAVPGTDVPVKQLL